MLIHNAKIMTIHSFCLYLIKIISTISVSTRIFGRRTRAKYAC